MRPARRDLSQISIPALVPFIHSVTACFALVGLLGGCALTPTRIIQNPERKLENAGLMMQAVKVTPDTLVVDARSQFEYSVAHIPRSVPMQWWDFTEPEKPQRGILQGDLFAASRRIARAGIGPDTKVVVVGRGLQGDGDEGRVAWMLAYLGVKQVQFVELDSLHAKLTNVVEGNPPAEVPMWKPEPIESLNVTREELQFVINKRGMHQPVSFKGRGHILYRIIDVRPAADYLGKQGFGAMNEVPNMDAINIPWTHFFARDMRPNPTLLTELAGVGVLPDQRIIVLGADGVSSAAVTMALRAMGYDKAGNCAGGLADLLSAYAMPSQ